MQYPLLKQAIITPLLPMMDLQGVSLVARGIVPSARTEYGFLQLYYKNKKQLGAQKATKNQNYLSMRDAYIKRAWTPGAKMFKIDGSPTRRHLSLVAWAFSPDPKRLQRFIKDNQLRNRNFTPFVGSLD
jgi:hypothetical protein